ncbi:uncharacterized protein CANTADRAFT_42844, partial [Suhomyces tanzawaensis NRRL Y-17324]
LEKLINRATDATLTSDNWEYILEVCDYISANPEDATKAALITISSRMLSKDANVMLRTLSLLMAIAENCGSRMKQEIATKSFLQESLVKRLGDRKIHQSIKIRIVEVVGQLNNEFKLDPSLRPMTDAYNTIKAEYPQYHKRAGPGPDKPAKKEISNSDKRKEEEELQRVLQVSLQEYEREQNLRKGYMNKPLPQEKLDQEKEHQPNKSPEPEAQTIATVSKVRALYDLISYEPEELSFRKGDVITVIESVYRDWWRGTLPSGKIGIFPLNYVTPIINKTADELAREAESEQTLLTIDLRKVDKLLALLSSKNTSVSEDEITQLYNEVIPLRTQLGKSIDKHSTRKEELFVLNNQLNNEVKAFNELMDALISQRASNNTSSTPYPT